MSRSVQVLSNQNTHKINIDSIMSIDNVKLSITMINKAINLQLTMKPIYNFEKGL